MQGSGAAIVLLRVQRSLILLLHTNTGLRLSYISVLLSSTVSSAHPGSNVDLRLSVESRLATTADGCLGFPTMGYAKDRLSFSFYRDISSDTTSLVGYPESLLHPSYRGQVLVLKSTGVPSTEIRDGFSIQFHSEAKGRPVDTDFLFEIYLESVQRHKSERHLFISTKKHRGDRLL